jgi:hypothetical protein
MDKLTRPTNQTVDELLATRTGDEIAALTDEDMQRLASEVANAVLA